jgi:hypothetical protein
MLKSTKPIFLRARHGATLEYQLTILVPEKNMAREELFLTSLFSGYQITESENLLWPIDIV